MAILVMFCSLSFAQTTWYVSASGDDENNTGSESSPWASIKKAINTAQADDIIQVKAGTYTEVNITVTKNLTIIGESPATTIVQATANKPDGAGTDKAPNQRVFMISGSVSATLKNMSIRYGNLSGGVGGGVNTQANAVLSIENCNIHDNFTDRAAGGIGGYGNTTIKNSSVFDNTAEGNGGGLAFFGVSLSIENCVVYRNHSNLKGGAISITNTGGVLSLNNNTIVSNTTNSDGRKGIFTENSTCSKVTNNILFNAALAGTDFGYDGSVNPVSSANVKNNFVSKCWLAEIRNEVNSITWETTPAATEENLKLASLKDNGNGLMSLALQVGSVAIDAGNAATATSTDIHGTSRVGTPDIGAYEYTTVTNIEQVKIETSVSPNPSNGTLNIEVNELTNGKVDIYSLNGKVLYSESITSGRTSIILPANINGLVFIKVSGEGYSEVFKHIVRK